MNEERKSRERAILADCLLKLEALWDEDFQEAEKKFGAGVYSFCPNEKLMHKILKIKAMLGEDF